MDERDHKAMDEELNQPSCLGAVIRWVAVTDAEPPLYAGDLLIAWKGHTRVGWYQNHTKLWWFSVTDAVDRGVTHWAEIPKPPCV